MAVRKNILKLAKKISGSVAMLVLSLIHISYIHVARSKTASGAASRTLCSASSLWRP